METPLKHEDNIDYVRKYNLARTSLRDYWETTKDDSKPDINITNIEKDDYNSKIKNANNAITKANQTIIKNANHWFLVNTISPEIQENEKRKRTHKTILLSFVILFLIVQFGFLGYLIYWIFSNIIECHKSGLSFNDSTIKAIFTFISGYITSIVIELIAILNYIVKNVFDTSVSGLANAFKENDHEVEIHKNEEQTD